MRPTRLFSKVRETVHLFGLVPIALLLIILVLVGVFLRLSGIWDIWPTRYTSITIIGNHTCGVLTNGTLRCWGDTSRRPPADDGFVAVAPGYGHACGLREDGSISCWGTIDDDYSPDPAPEASSEPFTSITAGFSYYCGLRADGSVVCWPDDFWGEKRHCAGLPGTTTSAECWGPEGFGTSPPDGVRFTTISTGHFDTCGLRMDGSAECWGRYLSGVEKCNSVRSDGVGVCWEHLPKEETEPLPEDERFKSISVGSQFACAIRLDDDIRCWGLKEAPPVLVSAYIKGPFIALSSGYDHACALRSSGEVYCWGSSTAHESDNYGDDPVSGERFVSISSGRYYNCALRRTGTARCWGGGNVNRIRPSE